MRLVLLAMAQTRAPPGWTGGADPASPYPGTACRVTASLQAEGDALLHGKVAAAQRGDGDIAAVRQRLVGALLVAHRLAAIEQAVLERLREHALLAPAIDFLARRVHHGEVVFLPARELELEVLLRGVGEIEREVNGARFGADDERTLQRRGRGR